ncbi:MAG TPA: hypothetical protein VF283_18210, partial [Bryobacteraceae bacterium]
NWAEICVLQAERCHTESKQAQAHHLINLHKSFLLGQASILCVPSSYRQTEERPSRNLAARNVPENAGLKGGALPMNPAAV